MSSWASLDSKLKDEPRQPRLARLRDRKQRLHLLNKQAALPHGIRPASERDDTHHQPAQVQGWTQQAARPHFGVELADRSQQQGGDRLRGGTPNGSTNARPRGRFRGPAAEAIPRPASCVADFEARELRGRLQGPPAAWPVCGPFRRRPSPSTKGAGAEVEEARAGRALSAPTARHPRRCSRTANTRCARMKACACRNSTRAQSTNMHFFLFRAGLP